MRNCEYVTVPLPKDEDKPEHPELEPSPFDLTSRFDDQLTSYGRELLSVMKISLANTSDTLVDPNDPRLTREIVEIDPEANAFADSVTLRVMSEGSMAVQWYGDGFRDPLRGSTTY